MDCSSRPQRKSSPICMSNRQWLHGILSAIILLLGVDVLSATEEIVVNGMTFQCDISGPEDGVGVILLHGFPLRKEYWEDLRQYWLDEGEQFRVVACNLRGYSPGASPDEPAGYDYEVMAADVFGLAEKIGWKEFHLVGHDHGALLGWIVARNGHQSISVLSYSALAVPHPDAFSNSMLNSDLQIVDEAQTVASNYFNQFMLLDSATRNGGALSPLLGRGGFRSNEEFQKALWWYAANVGVHVARPPVVSDDVLANYQHLDLVKAVRKAIPLAENNGTLQTKQLGKVSVPVLFLCGSNDVYLLCTRDGATSTRMFVEGSYSYLSVSCGHDILRRTDCDSDDDVNAAFISITNRIKQSITPQTTPLPSRSLRAHPWFWAAVLPLVLAKMACELNAA